MKKSRSIFYLIFGVYLLSLFIFSIVVDAKKEDIDFLLDLRIRIPWMKGIAILGLVLLAIDYLWVRLDGSRFRKAEEKFQNELNALKAELYEHGKTESTEAVAESVEAEEETTAEEATEDEEKTD